MIYKLKNNRNRYRHFFIPELEKYDEEEMKFVKNELLKKDSTIFTNYEEKRQEGENDSCICSLIHQDSVVEFITHLNRHNISPSGEILPSIFETNPFLIDNNKTTLIEYAAFFGYIQIFRYLLMNKAELQPSLWLYAIHSKNAELIHLLETIKIPSVNSKLKSLFSHLLLSIEKEEEEGKIKSSKNYVQYLIESIKCHHNDIADYIENNFLIQNEIDNQKRIEILSNCIKYHNYSYFQNEEIIDNGFFYLYFYHYDSLFKLLFKKEKEIDSRENRSISKYSKSVRKK